MMNKKGGEIFEVPLINLKKKRRKRYVYRKSRHDQIIAFDKARQR